VPHPSEICEYIEEHFPNRQRGAAGDQYPGPAPLLAYGSSRQHFAAATTGERKLNISNQSISPSSFLASYLIPLND